jgi:KUP system potassium uptake protein
MARDAVSPPNGARDKGGSGTPAATAFWALTIGSIGVVYGDIGTSPLYAVRESVLAAVGPSEPASEAVILGILSLIIWSLILIVTLKYVTILLRADNHGEGGTLALMALANRAFGGHSGTVVLLGIVSGALFYGDAIITPALSVLSAIEGLNVATPAFESYVMPITVAILVALFSVQARGTAKVAAFFGPVMLLWFFVIAVVGLWHVGKNIVVLFAFNPLHGVRFLLNHGLVGLVTLGAVFLVVTGSEALYADLGHFGRRPIRTAWLWVVLPALTINYLGQGALLLAEPKSIQNPFFLLYPDWALLPMVALATVAS